MKQLELRFYTRAEIAEVLSVDFDDSNHFKRNVENELSKSGYAFHYINRQGVEILSKPEAPEERLAEILYRGFKIDIQIQPIQFACFIAAFIEIEGFDSEPWGTRETQYYKYYGYSVTARTMRNWCNQLIDRGVIAKVGATTAWRTYYENGRKIREPIEEIDKVEMDNYFERRGEIFIDNYISRLKSGKVPKEARSLAWKDTYIDLWAEFECCFYYCKGFELSRIAYNDVDLMEIYELSQELVPTAAPRIKANTQKPTTQEGFVF